MHKEQIFTASTVDRAIEKALAELHLDRDAISVEVLDMGRKGFLGIGASDARIRVTYEVDTAPDPKPQPAPQDDQVPRLVKAAPPKPPIPPKPDEEQKPRLVRAAPSAPESAPTGRLDNAQWPKEAQSVVQFIDGLLEKLGVEGHAFVTDQTVSDHIYIDIEGPDMGPVIGRRGDTLDAIQYLASLVLNRSAEEHIRLTIDTENYRIKRAQSLERLARKMAGKVARYHKPMTLEPMNPYERRIIHAALQEYRGVTTHSTGTEPNRRVVISPDGGQRPAGKRAARGAAHTEEQ